MNQELGARPANMGARAILLVRSIHFGVGALLWMPLIVTINVVFPSLVGRSVFSRSTIGILFVLGLVLSPVPFVGAHRHDRHLPGQCTTGPLLSAVTRIEGPVGVIPWAHPA